MSSERLLQITVAAMAALATVLLCMSQRFVVLPTVVATAAFCSVWLTDVKGWVRLSRIPAGLAAVTALLYCLHQLFPLNPVTAILEIANLLIYLQLVLLFQKKETRIYRQLLMLSLLQVVVATVFNQGIWFGFLMVVYMFAALLALMLLHLVREEGSGQAVFPGREIFARVGMLGVGTLIFTAAAFFALPRLGQPAWRGQNVEPRRAVGYTNEVALGELGLIVEDPQEVMRVQFVDPNDGHRAPVLGEVYLQGAVLTYYEKGNWRSEPPPRRERRSRPMPDGREDRREISRQWEFDARVPPERRRYSGRRRWPRREDLEKELEPSADPPQKGVVRQAITIEPMDRRELFSMRPFFVTQTNPDLRLSDGGERLLRLAEYSGRRFTYHLDTTALENGRQSAYVPLAEEPDMEELLQMPENDLSNGLPNLTALAAAWTAETKLPPENWLARAMLLRQRLGNGERFQYSLEGQKRDWKIDPIEDFVVNNPRGHCEYFATALALMLRSQGIPARVAVGYMCDEFNDLGGFYQVRQLHAHTWVEMYLPHEKLPPGLQEEITSAGAWMRLDPTPAAASAAPPHPWIAPLAGSLDWLQFAWDNYVMEMDRTRQKQAIYQPLVNWVKSGVEKLKDPEWWRAVGRRVLFMLNPRNWNVSQWFSWRGGLVGMAICAAAVFSFRGCRYCYRLLRARWEDRRRRRSRAARVEVAFYRRLGAILAKRGLVKGESQTPREFARMAAERLAAAPETRELAVLPETVVEAFYLVRFGREALDEDRREEVETALGRLEGRGQGTGDR